MTVGVFYESRCLLKTKTDNFKSHWVVLEGNEIFCYRKKGDQQHRVMHCLAGTFIQEIPSEKDPVSNIDIYPVKIVLPPNKSRILYFDNQDQQVTWKKKLQKAMGYSNMFDFYEISENLGKGQFGLVKLAKHKKTGNIVAIKMVKKANMKQIEII